MDNDLPIYLPRDTTVGRVEYAGLEAVGLVLNLRGVEGDDVAFIVLFDSDDATALATDLINTAHNIKPLSEQSGTVEADTESQEDAQK